MSEVTAPLERSVTIAAPPSRVWELVHDPRRHSDWSPTLLSTRLKDADAPAVGVRFTNRNQDGELVWTTHAEIMAYDAERLLAFRVEENWAVWSFTVAEVDGGTLLTQRRETPDGISDLSVELVEGFMGGHETFTASVLAGMDATLDGIRAAAELSPRA